MSNLKAFEKDVQFLKGIGPKRKLLLNKLDINTYFDLLWNIPRQYEDLSHPMRPSEMSIGETAVLLGVVQSISKYHVRGGMVIVRVKLLCEDTIITAIWFNQTYIAETLHDGDEIVIRGKVNRIGLYSEIQVLHYEKVENIIACTSLLPIYPLTPGLNQKNMRQIMRAFLDTTIKDYPEILPDSLLREKNIMPINQAWENIHFPSNKEQGERARSRLAIEEYLLFRLMLKCEEKEYLERQNLPPLILDIEDEDTLFAHVRNSLKYKLTKAQERSICEIIEDMKRPFAMNRLLEGDVGSGKTLVAAFAMLAAILRGTQATFMAPTEILALQHYKSLKELFNGTGILIGCLTSSTSSKERNSILESLKNGDLNILVGTHALIQDKLIFKSLGLAVIDEQHRFGVRQRALLSEKGENPDILVMTATPIPRTLALSLYGKLSVSVLDELPSGRLPVKTKYLPRRERNAAFDFAVRRIMSGEQAYIVCPLVEESEKQTLIDVNTMYRDLIEKYGELIQIGVVHGKMKGEEKEAILESFKKGEVQLLISTTVIEVGVDVPQATVMIIEHAERFGLSQLHQLRGRVGRSSKQSYCILLGDPQSDIAYKRLLAMQDTNDGFKLANLDLKLRGPGDFWGTRQHGINDLKVLDLSQDQLLVETSEAILPIVRDNISKDVLDDYLKLKFPYLKEISRN